MVEGPRKTEIERKKKSRTRTRVNLDEISPSEDAFTFE